MPTFSQEDPAWRDSLMQIGTDSIGAAGCALTSTAMMLNYYGSSLTPAQLNSCLGASADPIIWKAVPSCTNGLVSGGDRIDFTWADLDALLASGRPAIVGMLRGQTGSHFVVVTQGGGGVADSYRITDPWDATTYKTLGSYINAGYTPAWIISYTGPGHNCGRLIRGATPAITGVQDGGATKNPVTINIAPNLKNLKFLGILQLSSGSILKDTFNLQLPFTKIAPGTIIGDEGIYQVLVTTQAPSQPPHVELYSFTIDKTPPAVDLALLNPRASSDRLQSLGTGAAAGATPLAVPTYPLIDKPGKIQVLSSDTLSGVHEIKYSLDGAPLAEYSSDTTFDRVLIVPQSGDHSIRIQSFDAAGNMQDATKYFTVYGYVPPAPSPTPTHAPPPQCPTKLILGSFTATFLAGTNSVTVDWKASGGCAPFSGQITVTYPPGIPPRTYPISQESGQWIDNGAPSCSQFPPGSVTYTLALKDKFGQTINKATPAANCP
ncbi:MAG: C39 family peptidase [Candidatus Dormiibacterota bacterium]